VAEQPATVHSLIRFHSWLQVTEPGNRFNIRSCRRSHFPQFRSVSWTVRTGIKPPSWSGQSPSWVIRSILRHFIFEVFPVLIRFCAGTVVNSVPIVRWCGVHKLIPLSGVQRMGSPLSAIYQQPKIRCGERSGEQLGASPRLIFNYILSGKMKSYINRFLAKSWSDRPLAPARPRALPLRSEGIG
jgi:hypothetical protein